MLRRLAIVAAMCCIQTAHADAVDDRLHAMSIKQLRWLLRDLGALDELPKGVALEKSDVIALAAPILREEEQKKRDALNSQRIWLALKVAGMLLVALIFGEPILAATQSARHAFVDGVEEKKHLARYAVECGSLFSAILVLITGVIDLLLCWVRLSVIISWVAPRNSSIRNFTIPIPSLGVDPAMAMGETKHPGVAQQTGPFTACALRRAQWHRQSRSLRGRQTKGPAEGRERTHASLSTE